MAWTSKKTVGCSCGTVININTGGSGSGGGSSTDTSALEKKIQELEEKLNNVNPTQQDGVFIFKGSVKTYDDLPKDAKEGYVYNVEEACEVSQSGDETADDKVKYYAGTNFVFNQGKWEAMNAPLGTFEEALNEVSDTFTTIVKEVNEVRLNDQKELDERLSSQYYTQNQVDTLLTNVYRYKGTASSIEALPTEGNQDGDVYNMTREVTINGKTYPAGVNVAYSGGTWDALGGQKTAEPKLESDLTVAGLTSPIGAGIENGDVFAEGTSIEDVLKKLLSKEIFIDSSTIKTNKTFTASYKMPTISLSPATSYAEIGSPVKLNAISKGTSSVSQTYNVGTFTYGYADYTNLIDKPTLIDSTTYTKSVTPTIKTEQNNFEVTFTSGFGNHAVITGETIPATDLTVDKGINSLTIKATGNTYTAEPVASTNLYIATNLGNFESETGILNTYRTVAQDAVDATATNSTTKQVTGVYKVFYGYTPAVDDYTQTFNKSVYTADDLSGFTSALFSEEGTTGKTKTIQSMSSTADASSHVIILPKTGTYELKISHLENSLGMSLTPTDYYTEQIPITYKCGEVASNYIIYILKSAVPVETKNIKISK